MIDDESLLNSLVAINKSLGIVEHCKCGIEWMPDMTQFGCWSCGAESPELNMQETLDAIDDLKKLAQIGAELSQSALKFEPNHEQNED